MKSLLRGGEVLQITFDDVKLDKTENVEVDIPHPTERSAKGFSFTIPSWLKPSFEKCMDQIPESKRGSESFLHNWEKSKDGKGRIQPMGCNRFRMLSKEVSLWWGIMIYTTSTCAWYHKLC